MLMNQPTKGSPLIAVMHDQEMIPFGDQIMRDERRRAVAGDAAFLIDEFFDDFSVCDDCHGAAAKFEAVEPAILLGPLCEPTFRYLRVVLDHSSRVDRDIGSQLALYAYMRQGSDGDSQ